MKKNLFRKFLALFLTGTMLAGVGCKDYDDDIDDLKGQINDLKGQVELKADASALKAVTDKLNGIDFSSFVTNSGLQTELDKRLADYAKKSDLKDWLTSDEVLKLIQAQGYQTKDEVQKLIDEATKGQLTADDVEKIFETMIASEETMGKLQAGIQEIIKQALITGEYVTEEQMKLFVEGKDYITATDQLSVTQINQILTAVANSVSSETATVTDAIKKVLGDNFASYMAEYMNDETVKAEMGKTITDTILKELTDANVTLKEAIEAMIEEGKQQTVQPRRQRNLPERSRSEGSFRQLRHAAPQSLERYRRPRRPHPVAGLRSDFARRGIEQCHFHRGTSLYRDG